MELSTKIAKYLCNVGIITNSDTELISYGVYLLLGNIASVFFIVLGGLFHKSIIEGLVFLVAFNLVRTKAGGFHLENGNMCFFNFDGISFINSDFNKKNTCSTFYFKFIKLNNSGIDCCYRAYRY